MQTVEGHCLSRTERPQGFFFCSPSGYSFKRDVHNTLQVPTAYIFLSHPDPGIDRRPCWSPITSGKYTLALFALRKRRETRKQEPHIQTDGRRSREKMELWYDSSTELLLSIHGHTHVKDERVKLRVDWLCGETRDGLREKFYYGNWERFWCLKCSGALDTAPVERRLMWYLCSVVLNYEPMTARCGSAISAGNQSTLVSGKFVIHHLKLQHLNYVKMISLKIVLVRWVEIFSGY